MLKLSSGKSEKDRISFYTSDNGATAIRREDGEIEIELVKKNTPILKAFVILLGIFGTTSLVKALVLMPLIKAETLATTWYLLPTFVYSLLAILSIVVGRKTGRQAFLRNHGAEHMVLSAYKHLKRVPTVEEAQRFSRINRTCGVTIYSAFITCQVIGFIVYLRTGYVISEIILFLVPLFFQTIFPFNFIGKIAQFFTTSKPERQNIELAIAALSALEKRELLGKMLSDVINNTFRH